MCNKDKVYGIKTRFVFFYWAFAFVYIITTVESLIC